MIPWPLLGVALAGLTIGIAHGLDRHTRAGVFAVLLILAAVIYLVFGAFHDVRWMAIEGAGVAFFSLLAWGGLRWPLSCSDAFLLEEPAFLRLAMRERRLEIKKRRAKAGIPNQP